MLNVEKSFQKKSIKNLWQIISATNSFNQTIDCVAFMYCNTRLCSAWVASMLRISRLCDPADGVSPLPRPREPRPRLPRPLPRAGGGGANAAGPSSESMAASAGSSMSTSLGWSPCCMRWALVLSISWEWERETSKTCCCCDHRLLNTHTQKLTSRISFSSSIVFFLDSLNFWIWQFDSKTSWALRKTWA